MKDAQAFLKNLESPKSPPPQGSGFVEIRPPAVDNGRIKLAVTKFGVSVDGQYMRSKFSSWLSVEPVGDAVITLPVKGELTLESIAGLVETMLTEMTGVVIKVIKANENEF